MIHIGKPIELNEQEFFSQLKELKDECQIESSDIRPLIRKIVPTYHYSSETCEKAGIRLRLGSMKGSKCNGQEKDLFIFPYHAW